MVSDIACYGNCAVISQCTEGLGWFRVEGVGQKVLFSYFAVRFLFSFFSPFHPYLIFISSLSLSLSLSLSPSLSLSLPLTLPPSLLPQIPFCQGKKDRKKDRK